MSLTPATSRQTADNSILDYFNRQAYLGNQFVFALGSSSIASTSEIPFLLLSNPTNSNSVGSFPNGKSLFQNSAKINCQTASQSVVMRLYLNPTVTNAGTVQTPVNVRPASPNVSIANLSTAPTTSASGTLIGSLITSAFNPDFSGALSILDPGNSLLVTVQATANPTVVSMQIGWMEF